MLAAIALVLGVGTFVLLAGGVAAAACSPSLVYRRWCWPTSSCCCCSARCWPGGSRGSGWSGGAARPGSRLHVRLVLLFSVVAVTPTIVVAVFATAFFNLGIQAWFNDRVRTALSESLEASRGYLEEHSQQHPRRRARHGQRPRAAPGSSAGQRPVRLRRRCWQTQTVLRGLTEAIDLSSRSPARSSPASGVMAGLGVEPPPTAATELARSGDVAVLGSPDGNQVRAVVQLNATPPLMLLIGAPGRPGDPRATWTAPSRRSREYKRLDQNRSGLQITFALIFALVALLVLSAAVLIGLVLANQIARPIGRLILAAERVRAGDLAVRVPEVQSEDEVAGLSRAFNRMTGQLAAQRTELMDAYSQIDERRRFTETVLAGVSAGVIGLDAEGRIELPNRAAGELLGIDLMARDRPPPGRRGAGVRAPAARRRRPTPERPRTAEVQIGPPASAAHPAGADRRRAARRAGVGRLRRHLRRHHRAAIGAAQGGLGGRGAAHRARDQEPADADPALRRAAEAALHQARSPSDPETFAQCADTIVRHVGDIGRMVDEFSAFARMPQPVIQPEDVGRIAREALVLQRSAHPEIAWTTDIPERGPVAPCDRRLLGQALTNLLQNAADAVAMRPREPGEPAGHIAARRAAGGRRRWR